MGSRIFGSSLCSFPVCENYRGNCRRAKVFLFPRLSASGAGLPVSAQWALVKRVTFTFFKRPRAQTLSCLTTLWKRAAAQPFPRTDVPSREAPCFKGSPLLLFLFLLL